MLLVNAQAGQSNIHGIGLIAQEFIPKGGKIWHFMPGFDVSIHETYLERLSSPARSQLFYYAYFHLDTRTFVLSSDDDRFTNHSDTPNTMPADDFTIALRDIHKDEEITIDYSGLVVLNFPEPNNYGVAFAKQYA
ncbi:MAG: SET domain-containing protein [Chloroflexota bacterium]